MDKENLNISVPLYINIPIKLNEKLRKKARDEQRTIRSVVCMILEEGLKCK